MKPMISCLCTYFNDNAVVMTLRYYLWWLFKIPLFWAFQIYQYIAVHSHTQNCSQYLRTKFSVNVPFDKEMRTLFRIRLEHPSYNPVTLLIFTVYLQIICFMPYLYKILVEIFPHSSVFKSSINFQAICSLNRLLITQRLPIMSLIFFVTS